MTDRVVFAVRVTPRAGRDEIGEVDDAGELRIRVAAPPTDGAANAGLTRLVAKTLSVPRGAVTVASGGRSRHKRVAVEGISADQIVRRWPGVSARPA
jgi:uncharacterized protein (TIGR00251 family)